MRDFYELLIRPAGEAEAAALATLIRAAFAEYAGRLDPPSSAHAKSPAKVAAELADGGAFVAERAGVMLGSVFWHRHPDHLYLDRLAVLPEQRRQGIGQALVGAVEQYAAGLGLSQVRLSVRLALPANRTYYERLGYRFLRFGTHAGYHEPTYVILTKSVGPAD